MTEVKYCTRCVMNNMRPSIKFNDNGVCYPCLNAERRNEVNWDKRKIELQRLCSKHRRSDGKYDCIIPASGGKDSWYQTYIMKEEMGMNPLIVKVCDSYEPTDAGAYNLYHMCDVFDVDLMVYSLSHNTMRRMTRIAFEEFGSPNWAVDLAIYSVPLKVAIALDVPLVVYGENIAYEYGGPDAKETYGAKDQIKNDVVKPIDWDFWRERGISDKQIDMIRYPTEEHVNKLEPIYLSYFFRWDGRKNYEFAKSRGFQDLEPEWERLGFIEQYDQIDSVGYLLHPWMKYPKFGHARATDVACYWIRNGYITREEGIKLVKEHDHKLDPNIVMDFLDFTGYTFEDFYQIRDKWYNPDLFKKIGNKWVRRFEVK